MRALCTVALLALVAAPAAVAQDSGETAFDLVRLDPSTRSTALAGAADALSGDDPAALYTNPALLSPEMERQLALGYLDHLAGIRAGFATYARTLPRVGRVALGVRYLSYGELEGAAPDGSSTGTFGASEAAVTATYAYDVSERFRVGASGHALFSTLDDASGQALTADLGAAYHVPSQLLTVTAALRHVGTVTSSLGETADVLPLDLRVGVAKELRYLPLTVSVSGFDLQSMSAPEGDSALDEALRHVAAGGELRLGSALALRAGYHPGRAEDLRTGGRLDLAGVSAGFGIDTRRVDLDYAYTGWSDFGGLHQFGVQVGL